jgi:hypothetical protein
VGHLPGEGGGASPFDDTPLLESVKLVDRIVFMSLSSKWRPLR